MLHKQTSTQVDGTVVIGGCSKSGGSGCKTYRSGHSSGGSSSRRSQQHHLLIPPRPERTGVVSGLDQDQLLPNPSVCQGKEEARGNTYPPIITIDGRVDTDLDHLIEDENEEDQRKLTHITLVRYIFKTSFF